jgi:hypothetical protein
MKVPIFFQIFQIVLSFLNLFVVFDYLIKKRKIDNAFYFNLIGALAMIIFFMLGYLKTF